MARSLRAHLLRMLLPPIAALLGLGAVIAYYPSMEPATEAYDQALVDIAIAVGSHVRVTESGYQFELPKAVEHVLMSDSYDKRFYRVVSPGGTDIAGDSGLPIGPGGDGVAASDTGFKGQNVRAVTVPAPCGKYECTVVVAETTVKRSRMTSWNSIRWAITACPRPPSRSVCSTRVKPPRSRHTTRSSLT